jgi:CHAT domain-containing protein
MLLEYVLGDDYSLLFAVTASGLKSYELPSKKTIEAVASRVRKTLTGSGSLADFDAASAELSQRGLGPVAVDLQHVKRIAFVPDGALHTVPLTALAVPGRPTSAPPEPLIARYEVSVTPSASTVITQKLIAGRAPAPKALAVLADPAFARSVEEPGEIHGYLNPRQPELSGIVLSLVNKNGEPEDGYLSVPEILSLNLPAELVVLSGCETGLCKNVVGDGITGLSRAFMRAGAPRVVASLWSVRDDATAELIGRFYEGMFKWKLRPAAALREAQLSILRDPGWRSPRYWAAFVFTGEWR